jgi:hypothetical protein
LWKKGHQAKSCKSKKNQDPKIRMVREMDGTKRETRRTVLDFEPVPESSDIESSDESMEERIIQDELRNLDKDLRKRNLLTLDEDRKEGAARCFGNYLS